MDRLQSLVERSKREFERVFGRTCDLVSVAPGRVNLIGEHTDTNDGFVLPAAIDRTVVVAMGRSPRASIAVSCDFPERAEFSVNAPKKLEGWSRFPAGVAWTLAEHGHSVSETQSTTVSDLPIGSGLSSSAAIELALLTAWNALDHLGLSALQLAHLGRHCEHRHIGVMCGVMDQMACALGKAGHAMLIDFRSFEVKHVPIPTGVSIVVCDTGMKRTLDGSAYNERKRECEEACAELGARSLRDATIESMQSLSGIALKRVRHVVTENERCQDFCRALETDDRASMGRLMAASHDSLRDDYEVSCLELDAMAEAARAGPGCFGARMTGAGFGGSCVALVETSQVQEFMEKTKLEYLRDLPSSEPRFSACKSSDGARLV